GKTPLPESASDRPEWIARACSPGAQSSMRRIGQGFIAWKMNWEQKRFAGCAELSAGLREVGMHVCRAGSDGVSLCQLSGGAIAPRGGKTANVVGVGCLDV